MLRLARGTVARCVARRPVAARAAFSATTSGSGSGKKRYHVWYMRRHQLKKEKREMKVKAKTKETRDLGVPGQVTPMSEDFNGWYRDVIREAKLADYAPVRGTMVIRPYGYAIWEGIQGWLDARFKEEGVENCYFPCFIPESFVKKEAQHVEGFAPELAVVTSAGNKELDEKLVVRPTSETIVNHMFSQWIQSYRDLPVRVNQWANVVRWEMRTKPFIRTTEFLWQEGHTAHATAEEAEADALKMVGVYEEFAKTQAAIPVVVGRKSRIERFAGAVSTYTIEAMMRDGKALQAGTSHNLGDNFAKAFETTYRNTDDEKLLVHQASWGVSTRMVGAVLMAHGDDTGLRLPPALAPVQVVVVALGKTDEEKAAVTEKAYDIQAVLKEAGVRAKVDVDMRMSFGDKVYKWERKGVPLRIELGPKDLAKEACVVARRDQGREGKEFGVSYEAETLVPKVKEKLEEMQVALYERAVEYRDSNIVDCDTMDELIETVMDGKWARVAWDGSDADERKVKERTGATIRCFPLEQPPGPKTCVATGKEAAEVCLFARAY